jgi:hypothetical protein
MRRVSPCLLGLLCAACASGDSSTPRSTPSNASVPPPTVSASAPGLLATSAPTSTSSVRAPIVARPAVPLTILAHPQPSGNVAVEPFVKAGCSGPKDGRATVADGEEAELDCAHAPDIAALKCDRVVVVGGLAELASMAPIARCEVAWVHSSMPGIERRFVGDVGCAEPRDSFGYLIERESKWVYAGRLSELREIYGPIQTPQRALAWVRAKGQTVLFDLHAPEGAMLTEESTKPEDVSFAEPTERGFHVRAFDRPRCSSGRDVQISALDLTVTSDGDINLDDAHTIYRGTAAR